MKQNHYYCKYIIYFLNYQRKYIKLFNLFGIMSFYVYFCRKIKYMEVEKMYNDWYELAKKELEKRKKMNNLYTDYILLKYYDTAVPTVIQQENGDYSISLVFDYWNKDENQNLKDDGKLLSQLKEYFDNTPKDVLEKEMKELDYLNEIGPYVITDENEIREQYKEIISPLLKELNDFLNNASEEELKRNWEVLKEWENIGPNALEFVKELEKYV